MKTITDFRTLMKYAKALADAEKSGTAEDIAEARQEHDAYRDLCLGADAMTVGLTIGDLHA